MRSSTLRRLVLTTVLGIAAVPFVPSVGTTGTGVAGAIGPCDWLFCIEDPSSATELDLRVDAVNAFGNTNFPVGGVSGGGAIALQILTNVTGSEAQYVGLGAKVTAGDCQLRDFTASGAISLVPFGDTTCQLYFEATYGGTTASVTYSFIPVLLPMTIDPPPLPAAVANSDIAQFWLTSNGENAYTWTVSATGACSTVPTSITAYAMIRFGPDTGVCTFTIDSPKTAVNAPSQLVTTVNVYPRETRTIAFVPGYEPPTSFGVFDPTGRVRIAAYSTTGADIVDYTATGCTIQNVSRYQVPGSFGGAQVLAYDLLLNSAFDPNRRECVLTYRDTISFGGEFSPDPTRFSIPYVNRTRNTAPTASFSSGTPSVAPATVGFDASGSTDNGVIRTYDWNFGNGTTAVGLTPTATFTDPGAYDVVLTVTDDGGLSNSVTKRITVTAPKVPGAPTTVAAAVVRPGTASVSFAPPVDDGGRPVTSYRAVCSSTDGGVGRSASGATSPLVVSGLTAGSRYQCRANATNAVGTGPGSSPSTAFVAVGPPAAPTDVRAALTGPATLSVAFTRPTVDGGSPITSYKVVCSSADGGVTRWTTGTGMCTDRAAAIITTTTRLTEGSPSAIAATLCMQSIISPSR